MISDPPTLVPATPHDASNNADPHSSLAPTRSRNRMRANSSKWSPEEDLLLSQLVGASTDWSEITTHFPGRTTKQVLAHWRKVADPTIVRGSWTNQEDQTIISWVSANGANKWAALAEQLPGRIPKQCRERWINHLDPNIKKDPFSQEEDMIIIQQMQQNGTKWAEIARLLPGRTDNQVKNRWNSTLKRRKFEELQLNPDFADFCKTIDQMNSQLPVTDGGVAHVDPTNFVNASAAFPELAMLLATQMQHKGAKQDFSLDNSIETSQKDSSSCLNDEHLTGNLNENLNVSLNGENLNVNLNGNFGEQLNEGTKEESTVENMAEQCVFETVHEGNAGGENAEAETAGLNVVVEAGGQGQ